MTTSLTGARVLTPAGWVGPAVVRMEDGMVAAIEAARGTVPDVTLAPGFVDVQVNGVDDVDVAGAATPEQWDRLDGLIAAQGVTTWCPTVITAPLPDIDAALARVGWAARRADGRPRPHIAGAHVEGPFLGGAPGAHAPEWIRPIDVGWLARLPDHVRVVTLAPELDGALDAVRLLASRGVVVSLGHSRASLEQASAAVAAGAGMVTHVFNAMAPLHHRRPGLVGAALADDRLVAGLIADNVHVHPRLLPVVFAAKSAARVVLVTDSVAWRAARVAGSGVHLTGGAPRRPDGTLAGSALTMDLAVANTVAAGVPLEQALVAASTAPARLLGLYDRGRLEPGARADIVVLDRDLTACATWVGGTQIAGR